MLRQHQARSRDRPAGNHSRVKTRIIRKPKESFAIPCIDIQLIAIQRKRTAAFADQKPFEMAVDQLPKCVRVYHS